MPRYSVGISRVSRVVHRREVLIEAASAAQAEDLALELDDGDEASWRETGREAQDYSVGTAVESDGGGRWAAGRALDHIAPEIMLSAILRVE